MVTPRNEYFVQVNGNERIGIKVSSLQIEEMTEDPLCAGGFCQKAFVGTSTFRLYSPTARETMNMCSHRPHMRLNFLICANVYGETVRCKNMLLLIKVKD